MLPAATDAGFSAAYFPARYLRAYSLPATCAMKFRDVLGVAALDDVGGHDPLAEALLGGTRGSVGQAAIVDRVQDQ